LRRAESVSDRLEDDEDIELVRRQCVQEMELTRAMSVAGFSDGCNSSEESDDGGEVQHRRLRDFDGMMSDDGSVISDSMSFAGSLSPPGSPRPQ